jgi:putative endonuclease
LFFKRSENIQDSRIGTGKNGEELAVRYLEEQGYAIVARNYRLRMGEIDIIARDGEFLVFVEVKTRRSSRFGSPFEAVDFRKQQQIIRVARMYLSRHGGENRAVRFDVVAVYFEQRTATIKLLKDAFRVSGE